MCLLREGSEALPARPAAVGKRDVKVAGETNLRLPGPRNFWMELSSQLELNFFAARVYIKIFFPHQSLPRSRKFILTMAAAELNRMAITG